MVKDCGCNHFYLFLLLFYSLLVNVVSSVYLLKFAVELYLYRDANMKDNLLYGTNVMCTFLNIYIYIYLNALFRKKYSWEMNDTYFSGHIDFLGKLLWVCTDFFINCTVL